jgi:hypothetical protein
LAYETLTDCKLIAIVFKRGGQVAFGERDITHVFAACEKKTLQVRVGFVLVG